MLTPRGSSTAARWGKFFRDTNSLQGSLKAPSISSKANRTSSARHPRRWMIPLPSSSRNCCSHFTSILTSESPPPRKSLWSRCALASAPTKMVVALRIKHAVRSWATLLLYTLNSATFNTDHQEAPDSLRLLLTDKTRHHLLQPWGWLWPWCRVWTGSLLLGPWGCSFARRLGERMTWEKGWQIENHPRTCTLPGCVTL